MLQQAAYRPLPMCPETAVCALSVPAGAPSALSLAAAGFMIVSALVRLLGMTVTEAVKRFAQHRSPGIYKRHYLESLYSYYHEKM